MRRIALCAVVVSVSVSACVQKQSPPWVSDSPPIVVGSPDAGAYDPNAALCARADEIATSTPPMAFTAFGAQPPRMGATVSRLTAPPAISGGTLRVLADGVTAVAADPDRDRLYVVDLAAARLAAPAIALQAGDEPGRVVEDTAGRVHVALRGAGAVVTIDPSSGRILARRDVCAAPRGLAHERATDLLHVACEGGELVSLPAAGGPATRVLHLDRDLRDVAVVGTRLYVSRFRAADVLIVQPDGSVSTSIEVPKFRSASVRAGNLFEPAVAWRMTPVPGGGVAVLHQRAMADELPPFVGPSYYGDPDACNTILHGAVTLVAPDGQTQSGPALGALALAVDLALSADGKRVAVVSAGNATNAEEENGAPGLTRLFVTDLASATDVTVGCRNDGIYGPCLARRDTGLIPLMEEDPATSAPAPCDSTGRGDAASTLFGLPAQPVAVAFDGRGRVVVQSREPATLIVNDGTQIPLDAAPAMDTGHAFFHANSGTHLACASCHPEGRDDGRVWHFACGGARRTQSLQTGISGTEPLHWDGHEQTFAALVGEVFVRRMGGPQMTPDQTVATLAWLDRQPRPHKASPADPAAVARGRAIFADATVGCATCHTGDHLTNNQSADVGTGGVFQVPSLVGISARAPYMHDGCAKTLRDRFGTCGGGDKHGVTSTLTPPALNDLLAYMQTL